MYAIFEFAYHFKGLWKGINTDYSFSIEQITKPFSNILIWFDQRNHKYNNYRNEILVVKDV